MDPKDFRITVSETFDEIEASLRDSAEETLESLRTDDSLVLQFQDLEEITLQKDESTQRLLVAFAPSASVRFYFHDIEERWFSDHSQEELLAYLNRLVAGKTDVEKTILKTDRP